MAKYEGVGRRMRERLLALEYRRADGEPDVQRFCWDHRFNPNHFHQWLSDKMTPFKDLVRLGHALDCSLEWLLTGAERVVKETPSGIMLRRPRARVRVLRQEFARAQ